MLGAIAFMVVDSPLDDPPALLAEERQRWKPRRSAKGNKSAGGNVGAILRQQN
jgi:hypothetical protein